ncbi:MAG: tagatose 1,6-diphosphate aldolase, partial [Acidobacteriaceae bacterium]|nr:tagatose 1,6-diphosphate aldolase [Acidobacteriaceae bacterium]
MHGLARLSNADGVIAALALDQRSSLRKMMGGNVSDRQLREFKSAVTKALSPYASAILLDPDYGLDAAANRDAACGLLLAYEVDGYENPRPHKMLAIPPRSSVQRLKDQGAQGIKILLSYTPFDDQTANDEKHALIERIGCECAGAGLPFFLEPVGYEPAGLDPRGPEFARLKPEIVIRSMREF